MSVFEDIYQSLRREFKRRKALNPSYSVRAFAKSIGLSTSRFSDILNKKRRPSAEQLEKINQLFDASWQVQFTNTAHLNNKNPFPNDQFEVISSWIYIAILSYLKEKKTGHKTESLASIFSMKTEAMENALECLYRMKLVTKTDDLWFWTHGPEKTSDQIPSQAIRTFHKGLLDLAKDKIETVPIDKRDFSSVVMTIDPSKIDFLKSEIQSFRRKLCTFAEDGEKKQVYTLNIQLYPLSTVDEKTSTQ